jgi:hypothetical protein
MPKPPNLKDWKGELESLLETVSLRKPDMVRVMHFAEALMEDMQPASNWLQDHRRWVSDLLANYQAMYRGRFHEEPPLRPKEERTGEILLDTPESRRQVIRGVALAISKPGEFITDEQVLEALKAQGKRLLADNPTATISTILNGYKSHFEKVEDKRGTFRRREPQPNGAAPPLS